MDFELSEHAQQIQRQLERFMQERVHPSEALARQQLAAAAGSHEDPPVVRELRGEARALGLWNLFLPDATHGAGLSTLEYAPLCERMGRSEIGPRVFNCDAPDTGNIEILVAFGSEAQKARWLAPSLAGEIRSCFAMTEPEVSGADPTGLRCRARREGDDYVIDGHKWFTTGARGAAFAIVMAVTAPDAAPHERASLIIVPTDTPGYELVRDVPVMGHTARSAHGEIRFSGCRVPVSHRLGPEHAGFAIAQARLGPGRIHHCMRCIGAAERAFEIMCAHAVARESFGGRLADKQFVQDWVARSRIEIDQARLLILSAARTLDRSGQRAARQEISMIKVVAPNVAMRVLDRAIQCLGALGMSDDTPIASMWRNIRGLRIADGPDEVHKMVIARRELARFES